MSQQNYIDRSNEALKYFHNASVPYPGYSLSFKELLLRINRNNEALVTKFLVNYGRSLVASELSTSEIKSIMENLARQGQGRIPADANVFFEALLSEVRNISWVSVGIEAIKDTASDLASGAQSFGDNVISTLKSLNIIFPILVVGGIVYIAVSKIKKAA